MKNLVRLMLVAMLSTMVALPAVASKARHVKQAHEGWSMVVSTGLNWFVGGYGNAASDANSGFSWSLAYHLNKDTSLWLTPAFTLSSVGDAYKGFSATAGANYVVNRTLGFEASVYGSASVNNDNKTWAGSVAAGWMIERHMHKNWSMMAMGNLFNVGFAEGKDTTWGLSLQASDIRFGVRAKW